MFWIALNKLGESYWARRLISSCGCVGYAKRSIVPGRGGGNEGYRTEVFSLGRLDTTAAVMISSMW